jgi:undecaprenyl-diphosphatase
MVMVLGSGCMLCSGFYVGVHYPGDVLAGAILGIGTGNLTFLLFIKCTTYIKRKIQKQMVQTKVTS